MRYRGVGVRVSGKGGRVHELVEKRDDVLSKKQIL